MIYEILTNRGVVGVFGNDAMNFLHNLATNDITKFNYCYTYSLSSQGRYLFDFFVFKKSETEFFIDINIEQIDLLKKHLMMYKLRSKVEITDLRDSYQVVYSKEKLDSSDALVSVRDPRYHELGFRSVERHCKTTKLSWHSCEINTHESTTTAMPPRNDDFHWSKFSQTPELYLQDKYNFVIIDGHEDLIYDRSIPVEYGGEELNALSYNKGCYIGQEVISRAKYQGVVRKKIFKISSEEDISQIKKNDEINIGDKKIGVVCSIYKNMGIGLVRVEEYSLYKNAIITINNIPISLSVPPWRTLI